MSFSSTGYEVDSHSNIMDRIYNAFLTVLPDLEFTPDNIITHWQQILAYEQRLTQIMLGDAINNFSVLSATGVFLERLGIEAGIIKKGELSANGNLIVMGDTNASNSLVSGSTFSTSDGKNYLSSTALSYPEIVSITRGDTHEDDVPSPYKSVTIDGLYEDISLLTGISTGYYSVTGDVIVWNNTGMASGVADGVLYYADVTGQIGLIVPVISDIAGADYNVAASKITVNTDGYSFVSSVTNENPFYNGKNVESDIDYRYRILKAKRKTFSLGRVESLCENLEGVRDAKTYQVTNTDRNTLGHDAKAWDINNLTGLTGNTFIPSGEWFGFSFHPSDEIATLKEIKLYGRVSGIEIPKLEYYLKPHYSSAYLTDTGYYLQKNYIEKYDLERDNYTGWQIITAPLKYNGTDNAKTYKVYLRESGFIAAASGHWEFIYSGIAVSSGYRNESYLTGIALGTKQLISRTMYGSPAYNADIVVEDGYRFDPEIKDDIEKILDYEEYGGNSPVCIQYDIRRALKTYLSLSVYIYVDSLYTFSNVVSDIKTNIGRYLRTVKSGENIYYSSVEKAIVNTDGVKKLKNMRMKLNDGTWVSRTTQDDISLSEKEYVDLDLSTLYDGVSILEG